MSPVGSPPQNPRRRSQQHHPSPHQDRAMPSTNAERNKALQEDDSFSVNPLAFTPALFDSLDALNDVDDGTLDQFKAGLDQDQRNSNSPPLEGQTRSTVSPDPSSGAPFSQRRHSSERDHILNAHNANSPSTFGEVPNGGGAARPMPTTALSDGSSRSEPPHAHPHSAPGRPSPPLSGAASSSNAFDVSYNGPPPASQFNFANAAPHGQQQQQNWMQPSDPSTSTPFDPSQVISFASGSPPFPDSQIQHQRQMIRGAVMQGMQQSRTQSQGPLHISTPNGNNLASTTLQTQHPHPGLSVSPSYPSEFTFPANRDSGGVHAAAGAADGMMAGAMPPSATSPSPSPSFSSSSVSTPVYNGANPNFLQSGNAAAGASSATAPPPPPTMHHPNPHKVSQSSLRSSSRPSPTPESGSSRESGHPYPSATRHHGGRTRRHPSDPNQLQTAQQLGGVAPDMSVYNARRTSLGPGPMPPRMTQRRSGMSPTIPPGRRYEQEQMMVGGTVRLVDPTTNQQLQFQNVQQWTHGVHADQSLNSPPSNGPERPRPANRASSSATSSESSLAAWNNSAEDLQRFSQAMEIQSPMGDAGEWAHWNAMAADPSMMQQTFNGTFDPSFAGLPEGTHYAPGVPAIAEDGGFQEGVFLNGPAQSPKQFVPVNGIVVSPPAGIQAQQAAWGPQTLSASMSLQGLQQ
ncbi:hypothetical protein FS837_008438 [Tulasnella sp. UAMH 9824]|nr:hypothetical protein FS837_008438 [Tulasnella sp. UAMH 9824]